MCVYIYSFEEEVYIQHFYVARIGLKITTSLTVSTGQPYTGMFLFNSQMWIRNLSIKTLDSNTVAGSFSQVTGSRDP